MHKNIYSTFIFELVWDKYSFKHVQETTASAHRLQLRPATQSVGNMIVK